MKQHDKNQAQRYAQLAAQELNMHGKVVIKKEGYTLVFKPDTEGTYILASK